MVIAILSIFLPCEIGHGIAAIAGQCLAQVIGTVILGSRLP
jgi:hypothetical protein